LRLIARHLSTPSQLQKDQLMSGPNDGPDNRRSVGMRQVARWIALILGPDGPYLRMALLYGAAISLLSHILYNRTRRQLEFIKERLDKSSLTRELAQSVVLTGGGSQLTGLSNLATEVLGRPVRIGAANNCAGLAPEYQGPALSTVVGLGLIHKAPAELVHASGVRKRTDETYMSRMEQWLRESF
ncbi:MAG: hypothetical protein AAFW82_08360, partial [Pseudomonadota bacterium]